MEEGNLCVILKRKEELCLEYRRVPQPLPHEVLIKIHSVGICGSDVHFWKDGRVGKRLMNGPMILGHECSGIVLKVGDRVKHLQEGDKVCIEPGISCRKCEFCKEGRYNICPKGKFCATPSMDGTLCRYYCHDADFCFKLPDNVTLEEGALVEPLSVAVHACRRSGVTAGKSVLICGAGPIGLLNLLTCKAMGSHKICITDISENRLAVAKKLGATSQICVKDKEVDDVIAEVAAKFGESPDITIECSGAESSIKLGIKVTKSGGRLILVGLGAAEVTLPLIEATVREVNIRSVFRYVNCFPTALELISSGTVDVKTLITHHFKLEESKRAFKAAHTGTDGAIKVLINCTK